MKHLILLVLGVFLLTGCMAVGPKYEHGEKFDTIKYGKQDHSVFLKSVDLGYDKMYGRKTYLNNYKFYEQIKRASEETVASGNKYFAIIENGTNNLKGFPISNFKDLYNYCFSYNDLNTNFLNQKAYSKCENIDVGNSIKIVMFKEKIPGIYLWDAETTLNDLK